MQMQEVQTSLHQKSSGKSLFLLSILFLFCLSVKGREEFIYINSDSKETPHTGSITNPYIDLQSGLTKALEKLTTMEIGTQFILKIKPGSSVYTIEDPQAVVFDGLEKHHSLKIVSWDEPFINHSGVPDCQNLPTISGSSFNIQFLNMEKIGFYGIHLVNLTGSVQVSQSQGVDISKSCINDQDSQANSFLKINNTSELSISNTISLISNGNSLVHFINDQPDQLVSRITITDFVMNLSNTSTSVSSIQTSFIFNTSTPNDPPRNSTFGNFRLKRWFKPQFFSANRVTLNIDQRQVLPAIAMIHGFDDVQIHSLSLQNQSFSLTDNGVFQVFDTMELHVTKTNITYNEIYPLDVSEIAVFFRLNTIFSFKISENMFSNNRVFATCQSLIFKLFDVKGIQTFILNNYTVTDNEFHGVTSLFRFSWQPSGASSDLNISNVHLQGNVMLENEMFSFLSYTQSSIHSLSLQNMQVLKNNITGRIFHFETVGFVRVNQNDLYINSVPTSLNFTNILIDNNQNMTNLVFLYFSSNNPDIVLPNYVFDTEFYCLNIKNLTVTNNMFFKAKSFDSLEQSSLIQTTGTQVYIHDSRIRNNSFSRWNFLSMEQQVSSVFFVNSTVSNNTIERGNFIITRYESMVITRGPFYTRGNQTILPLYRFAFILDSNFTDMNLHRSSLFILNNAILILSNNKLNSINLDNSFLLRAGNFRPPLIDLEDFIISRNKEEEENLLAANSYLWQVYSGTLERTYKGEPENVYFYAIEKNEMSNFSITSKAIITFQDYNFQQGIIEVRNNIMKDFYFEGNFTEIIHILELSKSFVFRDNTIDHLEGIGSLLRLNFLEMNDLCILSGNSISNMQGPSFLISSGGSVNSMNISNNVITDNTFSSSVIVIDLILNNGDIICTNNSFFNNIVYASDQFLYSKLSFVAITAQAAKGHQMLLFDKWKFQNNSYINMMSVSQYGHLNAFFSLLLGNSSVVIQDSHFDGITLKSEGNSVFYIASKEVNIINSTFEKITVYDGLSVFNFLSLEIMIKANNFSSMVVNGKGMIFLNALPFLQKIVSLQLRNNLFLSVDGEKGNVFVVEATHLALNATGNFFYDCLDTQAAFLFQDAHCNPCFISHSFFESPVNQTRNLFFQLDSVSGNFLVQDNTILSGKSGDDPGTFLFSTNCPNANMTITNLRRLNISYPLRIADVDSGNLTLQDISLNQSYYSMTKAGGYVVQITAAPINLISASLNLKNVSFYGVKFSRLYMNEKARAGVIAFIGFGNVMSYHWKLNIEDCIFESILNASALHIQMPAIYNIKIKNTTFQNLLNSYAPALNYFPTSGSVQSSILIENCTFDNNTALRGAGAISLNPSNYSLKNNKFTNNKAGELGGAILLQRTIRTQIFEENNLFKNNSARMGVDDGSILSKIKMELIFPPNTDMYFSPNKDAITIMNASRYHISKMGIRVTFLDRDGRPTQDIGSSKPTLVLTFGKQSTLTSLNCTLTQCEIDKFGVVLPGVAGDNINVTVFYYSAPQKNDGQFLLKTFEIQMRDCIPGEYFNKGTRTCDFCRNGSYSLGPSDSCQDCPMHADCTGGNVLIAHAGFFRKSNYSAKLYQCRQDGNQRCEFGKCKVGYTGPLCEACDFEKGYIESGLLKCAQCEDPFVSLGLSILIFVLYLLYKLFCISRLYSTNESFCSDLDLGYGAYRASESGYYVKLLIVYTQVISLVYLSNMEVREFMGSLSQIGNPSTFILVSLQCSLTAMGFAPEQLIYISSAILVLSPFVQCILIFLLAQTVIRKFSRSIHPWHYFRLAVLYIIMIEQPGIVGFLTAFLSCSEVYPDSGKEFIALHPNWVCSDPTYQYFKTFVILPSLIFWAVLIPVFLFLVLFLQRKRLDTLNVRMTWGALYNINKPEFYYWGTIVMILELIITYTAYAFQADLKARVFTLFLTLWTYQFVVRQCKPYVYAKFNSMESLTFSLLMLNILLGYFAIDNAYQWLKFGSYATLAILNLSMTLFLAWKLFDITVMRVFDLSVERFSYTLREKLSRGRERVLTVDSFADDDYRSERFDTGASSVEKERRKSTYAHQKRDEIFVL